MLYGILKYCVGFKKSQLLNGNFFVEWNQLELIFPHDGDN